ncbi:Uncharacterized protein Adt_14622 [Abeliophyllum distichum]|uniref:Uncharacterized protein n=1 Tax=Abeliophyllum distichum TaxID=126358 RepID=A0ABD1U178_9LAMI
MSSEVGSDSGREAISWGRGQEDEKAASSGRIVEGIDEDEVLSPAPLTVVPPRVRSSQQAETRGERIIEPGNLGRRETEVASGLRTAPTWKCIFFPSEVSEGQLREWHQMYRIPDNIEFVVPGPDYRADDPPLGTVALNQAVLAARLRLPFPRASWFFGTSSASHVLRLGISTVFILLSRTGRGRAGGMLQSRRRLGGSVVTQTPDSIKNWKKFWFFIRGPWQFAENDARPDLSIPVRYHELRYVAQEPTEESSERARDISENLRSSAVLITEENLISARLSPSLSDRPAACKSSELITCTYVSLHRKDLFRRLKAKVRPVKGRERSQLGTKIVPPGREWSLSSPLTLRTVRRGAWRRSPLQSPSEPSRPLLRPSDLPPGPQLQPTYLGSTTEKDEEFLRLRGTLPKPVRDFIKSNSPTREEIAGLPLSTRRAIRSVAKCWTPAQQKYLESMGVVDSVVAASFNVSRAAIQLTSASEKMGRLLSDVQVMRDEGRKVLEELEDEKRLRAASEDVLFRREEELKGKEAELRAMAEELERAGKARADLEADLEAERKNNSEMRAVVENSTAKEEAVAEFRSSDAYLAEQEMVYFLTMEELIETTVEKRPDCDVQFLRDELSDLK